MTESPRAPKAQNGVETHWRVAGSLPVLKLVAAAVFALLAIGFHGDPVALFGSGAVALGLAGWALRDVVVPVRLAADGDGVLIAAGLAGRRRRLAWSQIERVRVYRATRLGLRTETLEIDTGDSLHLFSRYDLGAEPDEVAGTLGDLRAGHAE